MFGVFVSSNIRKKEDERPEKHNKLENIWGVNTAVVQRVIELV